MEKITFKPTSKSFGSPEPYIPDGTFVILVQDGRAQVGRYEAATTDVPWPTILHPVNSVQLESDALDAVRSAFPDFEEIKDSQVYTCPPELATRAIWGEPSSSN